MRGKCVAWVKAKPKPGACLADAAEAPGIRGPHPGLRRLIQSIERSDVIGFPEFDAVVAEDRVCGRRVKEEIGQRELQQIVDAGEFFRFSADWPYDVASLGTVDLGLAERPKVIDRPVDAPSELGEALLLVLVDGSFLASESRAGAAGRSRRRSGSAA